MAMLLENKSSSGGAIMAGVLDSLPFGEAVMNRYIESVGQYDGYMNSQYDDEALIAALQQTNSLDLGLQANPYAYLGGLFISSDLVMMRDNERLSSGRIVL